MNYKTFIISLFTLLSLSPLVFAVTPPYVNNVQYIQYYPSYSPINISGDCGGLGPNYCTIAVLKPNGTIEILWQGGNFFNGVDYYPDLEGIYTLDVCDYPKDAPPCIPDFQNPQQNQIFTVKKFNLQYQQQIEALNNLVEKQQSQIQILQEQVSEHETRLGNIETAIERIKEKLQYYIRCILARTGLTC